MLVPDFQGVPRIVQEQAYALLQQATGKVLVTIPTDAIALADGGLHCIVLGLHLTR